MTERQENILAIALRLFAQQGYDSTPTSQIAKEAGVSEGLIFRHFQNKEGLLQAIMEDGQDRISAYVDEIIVETDPKKRLSLAIDLCPRLIREEYAFWSLQFTLKFRSTQFASLKHQHAGTIRLLQAGVEAFSALGYKSPVQETQLLLLLLEGLTAHLLVSSENNDVSEIIQFIKLKYNVD